MASVMTYG